MSEPESKPDALDEFINVVQKETKQVTDQYKRDLVSTNRRQFTASALVIPLYATAASLVQGVLNSLTPDLEQTVPPKNGVPYRNPTMKETFGSACFDASVVVLLVRGFITMSDKLKREEGMAPSDLTR